jgi:inorganic pyrophosphatase
VNLSNDIPIFLLPLYLCSWYKTPDDKPINSFGFDEKYLDVAEAKKVIEETHEAWKKLRSGETEAGKLWTGK